MAKNQKFIESNEKNLSNKNLSSNLLESEQKKEPKTKKSYCLFCTIVLKDGTKYENFHVKTLGENIIVGKTRTWLTTIFFDSIKQISIQIRKIRVPIEQVSYDEVFCEELRLAILNRLSDNTPLESSYNPLIVQTNIEQSKISKIAKIERKLNKEITKRSNTHIIKRSPASYEDPLESLSISEILVKVKSLIHLSRNEITYRLSKELNAIDRKILSTILSMKKRDIKTLQI